MNQNFEYLEDDYGDKLISQVFGKDHQKIKNFEDFKESVKFGKVSLKFKYDSKLIHEFVGNQNSGFYNGIRNLKNIGVIIYFGYSMLINSDYKILYLIPILFIIRKIIYYMWHKKLITTIILILAAYLTCNYLHFNYKTILIAFIILQSISHSAYLNFLEEYFSFDEIRFGHGIENKLITKIYDSYNNRLIDNL